ncbi:MAG: DUF4102 domain-containing protein [Gemmatimonadetes bacterium]|nr:DUF4102 domain-containing protein [Gemmatimonadota bacterium]MYB98914.1 DUF4102 domain-containing protein [Gemmatimonadota bacterium]MYK66394.1 DUF4102 domain-containing protein [Gemmatimonadota bacterium]
MGGKLTAAFVKRVSEPGIYSDGPGAFGLSLRVRSGARGVSRTWIQRIRIDRRPTYLGLGRYPVVTLAEARVAALENYRAVFRGGDPRQQREAATVPTIAEAAEAVIALHSKSWGAESDLPHKWAATFRLHVNPLMGDMTVDRVTARDVSRVLRPVWSSKPTVAKGIRQRLAAVLRWAQAEGHRQDDPMPAALAALPSNGGRKVEHFRALHHSEVAAALRRIRETTGPGEASRLALRFAVLCAARPSEVTGARWSEIDRAAAVWTIPARRTKQRRQHEVPLSREALDVLAEARNLGDGRLVFPAPRGGELRPLALRRVANASNAGSPHGTARASFRSWCADEGVDRALAESALGHVLRGVEASYQRSTMVERRREVMERWGRYAAGGDGALKEGD